MVSYVTKEGDYMDNMQNNSANENTLMVFNKFLVEELPNVLKRNVASGVARSILNYSLRNSEKQSSVRMATFEYTSETNSYCFEVVKEEFMRYMQSICLSGYKRLASIEKGDAFITIDTARLIAFLGERWPELVQFPEIEWDSDLTFAVFNSFVFDEIPAIVERCKIEGKVGSYIEFVLEDSGENFPTKMAVFRYQSPTNSYEAKVKKEEFMNYMLTLPFIRYRKPTKEYNGEAFIMFNTAVLENYYLEELQKEDHSRLM